MPIRPRSCWIWNTALILSAATTAFSQDGDFLPETVGPADFQHVSENSPFTRPLDLSTSLVLTGVAEIGGKPMAVLMDKETKEIHVVSDEPNPEGWKVVEIEHNSDPNEVVAKISVAGSAIANVKYKPSALSPKPKVMEVKYNDRGYAIPPQALMDKYRKMNRDQQRAYQAWRAKLVKKDPSMNHSHKRFPLADKAIDTILAGGRPADP
ncbi:MAG: hypothetical protein AAF585_25235 [Verrucomicrobiota bacterium]